MYSYSPFLRVTPPGGAPIINDLAAIDRMIVAQWIPEPVFNQKETVRRRLHNIPYGWRLRLFFAWVVDPGSVSELTLVNVALYINRRAHLVELSMNGGATYREVVLSGNGWTRNNVEEKNVLGLYQAEFACVDLLSEDSLPPELAQAPPGLGAWAGPVPA